VSRRRPKPAPTYDGPLDWGTIAAAAAARNSGFLFLRPEDLAATVGMELRQVPPEWVPRKGEVVFELLAPGQPSRLIPRPPQPKPWEVTRGEYAGPRPLGWKVARKPGDQDMELLRYHYRFSTHPQKVEDAVAAGLPVPERVRAEYPDLGTGKVPGRWVPAPGSYNPLSEEAES